MYEFNEPNIRSLIDLLNTRDFNLMITTLHPVKGVSYDRKETWFGTEYGCMAFPSDWRQLWSSSATIEALRLPARNPYVASNFDLIEHTEIPRGPVKLLDTPVVELWFRPDDKFLLPHAFQYFYFKSDVCRRDATSMALLNLMSLVLKYYLVESLYPATAAGLGYEMYSAELGLVLKTSGFNEKIHMIVEKYAELLRKFPDVISRDVFSVIKTQMRKNYNNLYIRPKALSKDLRLEVLQEVYYPSLEKYVVSESLTFDQLKIFSTSFIEKLKIQVVIQGNVAQDQAVTVTQKLVDALACQPLDEEPKMLTRELPLGAKYIRVKALRKQDVNSTITNYYQVGPSSIKKTAQLDLLISLFEEPLFDTLRTKNQLGYDVSTGVKDTFGVLGYTIVVNSQENKNSASEVDAKIEEFRCETFLQILREMPEEDFEVAKHSLIKLKMLPDTELKEEVGRTWVEVTECEYIFDRRLREVEELKLITKDEMRQFYERLIGAENRKLSIQVIGDERIPEGSQAAEEMFSEELEFDEPQKGLDCVSNLQEYKKSLKTFPVIKTIL